MLIPVLRRPQTAAAASAVLDNFTDTNGTALASHTIAPTNTVGASWTTPAGGWAIQSNKAQNTGTADLAADQAILDFGSADVTITAVCQTADASTVGILFRASGTADFWVAIIDPANDLVRLLDVTGGGVASVDDGAATLAPATDYTLQVVLSGTSITVKLDGATAVTKTSAVRQAVTKCGLRGYDVGGKVDSFAVVLT